MTADDTAGASPPGVTAPPVTRPRGAAAPSAIAAALRRAGVTDVGDSTLERALYSSDASLYRVVPAVVARPRDADEVAAILDVCRGLAVPVTCRGAGTSIAGNAIGPGVVVDFARHMNRVLAVDPDTRTAVVQPGVVQQQLQQAAAPFGLRFGPDPSTSSRCTIGGMIGNDACGSRSLQYGRTSDNVVSVEALTADGHCLRLPPGSGDGDDGARFCGLRAAVADGLATIRTEFGRFGRQVSGYALHHLLPEHGFDLRGVLVGSEGTLAVVTEATVRLVRDTPHRLLAVLGYPDMATAADAAAEIVALSPATCEGLDSRLVEVVRARRGPAAVPELPGGSGWLFVEVTGDSAAEARDRARQVAAAADAQAALVVDDPDHARALWRIREDGAGLAGRTVDGRPAYPGLEDSAVPPQTLGRYLRDLDGLLAEHGLTGVPYGHFGDGCLHLRLDFPLDQPRGRAVLRAFLFDAARLIARYGGSLSGEHGDGRTRSELLPIMYSAAALDLFAAVKATFDPTGLLNPGILVDPRPVDADVRTPRPVAVSGRLALRYPHDGGDFAAAVHRCSGVGRCVADNTAHGGVMCPSYLATRREQDSTRGRARVLQEMVDGTVVTGGWRAREVRAALDLCLSCKACSAECPAGVDMAAYKAEVLYQAYRRRPRPRTHYSLGWLPRWAGVASAAPALVNAAMTAPVLGRAARFVAGVDARRTLPSFASTTFRAWFARRRRGDGRGAPVMLFVDTFTNHFDPAVGVAAVEVLERAGFDVRVPARPVCCALTWISTGQLDAARRILRRTVAELQPAVDAGIPIVGVEPSCTAVLRRDGVDLLGAQAGRLAGAVRTLAELLSATPGWRPPNLTGAHVIAQPHCHHVAVLGWDTDAALLRRAGVELTRLGGCCGLAGNFGVERGHYEISVAVAETALLPAVRSAPPDALLLADGFSCRTQLADLTDRRGLHLAQLLANRGLRPLRRRPPRSRVPRPLCYCSVHIDGACRGRRIGARGISVRDTQ